MANLIGNFGFIRIDGELQLPRQRHSLETRAGVDGTAVWKTGTRADPQRLVTVVDTLNEGAATLLYRMYVDETSRLVRIEVNGVSWTYVDYLILNVEKLRIRNHLAAVGGLFGGYTLLTCAWDVLPVFRDGQS